MLRNYNKDPEGIEEARQVIREILSHLGNGDKINFREKISLTTHSQMEVLPVHV